MERLTIAIADDNERMLEMLNALIQTENGMELVGTAANGEDAVELIRKNTPDVVLLDLIMPKMDGLGVMEKLKEDKSLKKFPGNYCTFCNRAGERDRGCLCFGRKLLYYETV